jgi:hypothetical protein
MKEKEDRGNTNKSSPSPLQSGRKEKAFCFVVFFCFSFFAEKYLFFLLRHLASNPRSAV